MMFLCNWLIFKGSMFIFRGVPEKGRLYIYIYSYLEEVLLGASKTWCYRIIISKIPNVRPTYNWVICRVYWGEISRLKLGKRPLLKLLPQKVGFCFLEDVLLVCFLKPSTS